MVFVLYVIVYPIFVIVFVFGAKVVVTVFVPFFTVVSGSVIVAVDVVRLTSVKVEVDAVNVVVVLAGTGSVSVMIGASGERRSMFASSRRSRVALSCSNLFLSCSALSGVSARLAFLLTLILRPLGIGTTVGLMRHSGSGLLGLGGTVHVG